MRIISCAVVDDEPLALKLIENFIGRTPFLELTRSFTDPVEAMDYLRREPVDLLFLDINMPDMDGLELAHIIPASTRIIFTTAFKEYAFDSYEVAAMDYLLKPIRYDKFLRAAEKAQAWFGRPAQASSSGAEPAPAEEAAAGSAVEDAMFIRVDGELRRLEFDRILVVEGMKDYVRFHLAGSGKSMISHLTMKSVEDILPPGRFMRISRSHIISLGSVRSIDRNMCVYIGDHVLRVTDMYRPAFEDYIQRHKVNP